MSDPIPRLNAALTDRYRIERELGEGGMATVYLADDLRHERKVALKVLKPELAAIVGAERFLAEIKTTANLQHPHILPLFDSGEVDGFLFYVMPYVEGESLSERIRREGQLPVDEAVGVANKVATALQAAHERGVVHRDIKPANILLSRDEPLVADFGIALAVTAAGGGRLTETGLSIGTPYYMSPEQATADRDADARSDVYSLGCVLYEMLIGEPPYTGASAQAVLGKILTSEAPEPRVARPSIPRNVDAAIRKSLEKLPADRFSSAGGFAGALADPFFAFDRLGPGVARQSVRGASIWAATVAALAVIAGWGWLRAGAERGGDVTRLTIDFPDAPLSVNEWGPSVYLTPDGTTIGYRGPDGFWWTRDMDALQSVRTERSEEYMSFAPEGRDMAFRTGAYVGELWVQSEGGERLEELNDSVGGFGIHWGSDGWIYYSRRQRGLSRISPANGTIEGVTELDGDRDEIFHGWPHLLPDGRGLVFTIGRIDRYAMDERYVSVLDFSTGATRELARGVSAKYVPTGHLVFVQADGGLFGVPFDLRSLSTAGQAVQLATGIAVGGGERGADFDVSLTGAGALVYVTAGDGNLDEVLFIRRDGTIDEVIDGWGGRLQGPAISPDGTTLAITVFRDQQPPNVFLMDLATRSRQRFTFGTVLDYDAKWVRGGEALVFVGPRPPERSDWDVYLKPLDQSQPTQLVLDARGEVRDPDFTAGGEWVVYVEESGGQYDIRTRRFDDDEAEVIDIAATGFAETSPALSPDGRWIAYSSDAGGQRQVYIRPFPSLSAGARQMSLSGGERPEWSPDGLELFYINDNDEMEVVSVSEAGVAGARETLFPMPPRASRSRSFAVAPDGRFIVVRRPGATATGHAVLVQNFFEELRERVPR